TGKGPREQLIELSTLVFSTAQHHRAGTQRHSLGRRHRRTSRATRPSLLLKLQPCQVRAADAQDDGSKSPQRYQADGASRTSATLACAAESQSPESPDSGLACSSRT